MDLPQFGFVEDLDEGERLLVAGGGVDHIDVFGTATDQRGDGHDLGTQLLHYAKVEAQLIAVAQGDQLAGLHVRLFGQPSIQQHHTAAFDGGALDGRVDEVHHESI